MTDYRAIARDVLAPDFDSSNQPPLHFACDSAEPNCTGHIYGFKNNKVIIRGVGADAGYWFVRGAGNRATRHASEQLAMDAAELGENAEAPKEFKPEKRGTQAFLDDERRENALVGGENRSHAENNSGEIGEVNDEEDEAEDAGLPDKHEATQYAGKQFDDEPKARKATTSGTSGYTSDQGVAAPKLGAPPGFHSSGGGDAERQALAGFLKDCGLDQSAVQKACDIACGGRDSGGGMSSSMNALGQNADPGTGGYQMNEWDKPGTDTFDRIGHMGMGGQDDEIPESNFSKPI